MAVTVKYDRPDEKGITLRQHLKQAGRPGPLPEIPDDGEYLWRWFRALSRARGSNGFGPMAITYSEISAWSQMTGAEPDGFEIRTIMAMDAVFLGADVEHVEW